MAVSTRRGRHSKKRFPWSIVGAVALAVLLLAGSALLYLFVLRGHVAAAGLSLSQATVTPEQGVVATVRLENRGWLDGDYRVAVLMDGQEKAGQDVTLKGRETRDVAINLIDIPAGSHKVGIANLSQDLRVLLPAAFEVIHFWTETPTCMVGENAVFKASIRNTGEIAGNYTATAVLDGSLIPPQTVRIEPGATVELQIPVTRPEAGAHVAELENASASIQVLRPASIHATELIAQKYTEAGKDAQLTALVTNSGDVEGAYELKLLVNGKVQQTKDVTVQGQQTLRVTLTLTLANTGKYELQAGEAPVQTVYAVKIGRPNNSTLLVKKANGGSGKLTLVNNYEQDAVFILASAKDPKTPLLSVYVRGKSKANNVKIKDGDYIVFYSLGADFDTASRRFTKNAIYSRFTDPINYKTTKKSGYIYYSTWTITLKSSEGNATTDIVPEEQFPD